MKCETDNKVKVYIPSETATKQLAIQTSPNNTRKITVSSNFLPLFGFEKGMDVVEEVIGDGKGMIVRLATPEDQKPKKVYERTYKNRKNNPFETMLDIRGQAKLDKAFPASTKKVHVTFTQGKVVIVPISDRQAERIALAKSADTLMDAFVACSSGVDCTSLHEEGFKVSTLLEWRPNEKRDKRDMTETGALNGLANTPDIKNLINEDIGEIDLDRLANMTMDSKSSLFHLSLQCDDFSPLKTKRLKEQALEDLSTSSDMVYDAMRIIEKMKFPTILLENVPGFMTSEANAILETKLRKWGYKTHKRIAYSPAYGGQTKRKRYYLFATSFPVPFSWPEETLERSVPIWDEFVAPYLSDLRDVSHAKSIQDGKSGGRLRVINKDTLTAPTILKSQNRMAKDSVVVEMEDGRFLFPNNEMIQALMGIPKSFSTHATSDTIASEILGQSIDYRMHSKILQSIREHFDLASSFLHGRRQLTLF